MERFFKNLKETGKKYAIPAVLFGASAGFFLNKNALVGLLFGGLGIFALSRVKDSGGSQHHMAQNLEEVSYKGGPRAFYSSSERITLAEEQQAKAA